MIDEQRLRQIKAEHHEQINALKGERSTMTDNAELIARLRGRRFTLFRLAADALQAAHERAERAEDRLRKINVLAQNAGVADAHHITDLTRERDNLAAQLAKAREALELYGEHQDECKVRIDILKDRDCGLSETLASLPAQPEGWRPIESAPRDGTHILIVWPLGKTNARLTVAQWIKGAKQGWWTPTDATFRHYLHPTHWMPLPTPPTKGEG